MKRTYPDTIVLVHRREREHKCSVLPLRGQDGFAFHSYPEPNSRSLDGDSLDGYVRLGFGGPQLSAADQSHGLLILDATWKLARRMENVYREVPVRSLPACETAYPRVSKADDDPMGGLATIEAIYLAYTILGRETDGLLENYHWAEKFLSLNQFAEQGKSTS